MELLFLRLWKWLKTTKGGPLAKGKNAAKAATRNANPDARPLDLPTELLLMILFYVEDVHDIFSLALTSCHLYKVSWAILYKSISTRLDIAGRKFPGMTTLSGSNHIKLYNTLLEPRIATLVTDFQVHIAACPKLGFRGACSCDSFDLLLGQALVSLENLRALRFTCRCCRTENLRHTYLAELKTTKLQEFELYCDCKTWSRDNMSNFLAAGCMKSVTSLSILDSNHIWDFEAIRGVDCLPRLKKIQCMDRSLLDSLLKKRTVTHLTCDQPGWDESRLLKSLEQTSLTHFNIANSTECYPAFLSTSLETFSNLRYIGRLHFRIATFSSMDLDDTVRWLCCFPRLTSIQVWMNYSFQPRVPLNLFSYPGDDKLVQELARPIPGLKKVYVKIMPPVSRENNPCSFRVWELQGSQWRGQDVPEFSSWDILSDLV